MCFYEALENRYISRLIAFYFVTLHIMQAYLRSWLSCVSCSIGCISSWGEGVRVAVDW